jgi:hypothetical protein
VSATATECGQRYRCQCRHVFQVFGGGRHRRFYELDDLRAPAAHDARLLVPGRTGRRLDH